MIKIDLWLLVLDCFKDIFPDKIRKIWQFPSKLKWTTKLKTYFFVGTVNFKGTQSLNYVYFYHTLIGWFNLAASELLTNEFNQ